MKRMVLIGALALMVGCGGGGQNPTLEPMLDKTLDYPAYMATGPNGEKMYLQVVEDGGAVEGSFYFFFRQDGEDHAFSGNVTGTRKADGAMQIRLHNPFDPTSEDIVLEGNRTANGMSLHDVDVPAENFAFAALPGGPKSVDVTRGGSIECWLAFGPDKHASTYRQAWYRFDSGGDPFWIVPYTHEGSIRAAFPSSGPLLGDRWHRTYWHHWDNGTSWIDIYVDGKLKARLWAYEEPRDYQGQLLNWLKSESAMEVNGEWVGANGEIRNRGKGIPFN
ncbi:MAG: hypothetical protein ACO1SV_16755 [Fimbriimonas sp.]